MLGTEISTPGGTHSGDRVTENTFSVASDRKELSDSSRLVYCAIRVSAHHPIGHCPVRPDAPTVGRLLGNPPQWRKRGVRMTAPVAPGRWPFLGHTPALLRQRFAFTSSLHEHGEIVKLY